MNENIQIIGINQIQNLTPGKAYWVQLQGFTTKDVANKVAKNLEELAKKLDIKLFITDEKVDIKEMGTDTLND